MNLKLMMRCAALTSLCLFGAAPLLAQEADDGTAPAAPADKPIPVTDIDFADVGHCRTPKVEIVVGIRAQNVATGTVDVFHTANTA